MVLGKLGEEFFKRGQRHKKKNGKSDDTDVNERLFEAFLKDSHEVKFAV